MKTKTKKRLIVIMSAMLIFVLTVVLKCVPFLQV